MQAIIVAAGESSRFWPLNKVHKSQIKVLGQTLLYWTIKDVSEKGINEIILIIAPGFPYKDELSLLAKDLGVSLSFVVQDRPLGTGNAIFQAKKYIKGPFFIFWSDKIQAGEVIGDILKAVEETGAEAVLTGLETDTPWDFGIVRMENNRVAEIVENPPKGKEPSNIKVFGAYFLQPNFFDYYEKLKKHHPEDFVDALNSYIKEKATSLIVLKDEIPVLHYPWEALHFLEVMLNSDELKNYVSADAQIGANVVIDGKVFIGAKAVIGDNTVIHGPCHIGENCHIGANNVFRGPVDLEKGVVTGSFTEIKDCLIQEGTHVHSGYFGDSVIGRNCRFGAGFITANRRIDRGNINSVVKGEKTDTGRTYWGMAVGEGSKFGIGCGTMPGILIGSNCVVGPGTLVFDNLEDDSSLSTDFKTTKRQNNGR